MRLKISFEDVKKLFNYLDKKGQGEIGYEEFTLLLEERWRGIDPVTKFKEGLKNRERNPMELKYKPQIDFEDCATDLDVFNKLESLSKNRMSHPARIADYSVTGKINRQAVSEHASKVQGRYCIKNNSMADLMKHSYLT